MVLGDSDEKDYFSLKINIYYCYKFHYHLKVDSKTVIRSSHGVLLTVVVSGFDSDKYFRFESLFEVIQVYLQACALKVII